MKQFNTLVLALIFIMGLLAGCEESAPPQAQVTETPAPSKSELLNITSKDISAEDFALVVTQKAKSQGDSLVELFISYDEKLLEWSDANIDVYSFLLDDKLMVLAYFKSGDDLVGNVASYESLSAFISDAGSDIAGDYNLGVELFGVDPVNGFVMYRGAQPSVQFLTREGIEFMRDMGDDMATLSPEEDSEYRTAYETYVKNQTGKTELADIDFYRYRNFIEEEPLGDSDFVYIFDIYLGGSRGATVGQALQFTDEELISNSLLNDVSTFNLFFNEIWAEPLSEVPNTEDIGTDGSYEINIRDYFMRNSNYSMVVFDPDGNRIFVALWSYNEETGLNEVSERQWYNGYTEPTA
jgi:hypothetical protein